MSKYKLLWEYRKARFNPKWMKEKSGHSSPKRGCLIHSIDNFYCAHSVSDTILNICAESFNPHNDKYCYPIYFNMYRSLK